MSYVYLQDTCTYDPCSGYLQPYRARPMKLQVSSLLRKHFNLHDDIIIGQFFHCCLWPAVVRRVPASVSRLEYTLFDFSLLRHHAAVDLAIHFTGFRNYRIPIAHP